MKRGSPLSALGHHEFRLLFTGLTAANLGIWMQQFAVGWLVVQLAIRDGNADLAGFYLGLSSLASAAPALGFGLFAGVIADRTDRRDLLVAARIASAVVAALFAIVVITDRANIVVVMILSAASSAAFAFDPPGRMAILPNVVPGRDLFSAMGLVRSSMQTAHTLGPLIAGLLIVPIGVGGVLLAKVGLVLGSVGALLPMRRQPAHAGARDLGVFASLREGLDYVRRDELIRSAVILHLVFAILGQPFVHLLPALAVRTLGVGAVELSWMTGAAGLGSLMGAVMITGFGRIQRRGRMLLATMVAFGVMLVAFGLQRELLGTLVVLVTLGTLQQAFLGTQTVILQLASPDRLRGRVVGMQAVIFMSAGPLGVLFLGTLGTLIGISTALVLAGAAVLVVAIAVFARSATLRDHREGGSFKSERAEATAAAADLAEGTD